MLTILYKGSDVISSLLRLERFFFFLRVIPLKSIVLTAVPSFYGRAILHITDVKSVCLVSHLLKDFGTGSGLGLLQIK